MKHRKIRALYLKFFAFFLLLLLFWMVKFGGENGEITLWLYFYFLVEKRKERADRERNQKKKKTTKKKKRERATLDSHLPIYQCHTRKTRRGPPNQTFKYGEVNGTIHPFYSSTLCISSLY